MAKRMGAVGGLGVVAEAVDSFRHLLRKYAIRRASRAFGPHRGGRAEKASTPCHHPLVRRLRLAREQRLPAALDDQSRRRGARGAAIDAARVDVPIAGSVLGMPFAHQCDRRPAPLTRPCVPYRHGKGLWRALCLSCGTSLERIAPESLTRSLSEFVHGHIWWHGLGTPQNRVRGRQSRSRPMLKWINGDARR